ncbi:MAG: cyclase dehydrase [Hyphomicrobiales bacterium]|nr:cyclase dehydrase [Hyphomicrobiales bacterium]
MQTRIDVHTRRAYERHERRARGMATSLGWFSIGLGLAELLAPREIARFLGLEGRETLIRSYGLRELGNGWGLLSAQDPAPWMWARVGGDAIDLATLSLGMERDNPQRDNVVLAAAAVAGITALDLYCAQELDACRRIEESPDYSSRSGFPRGQGTARGIARDKASAMRPRFVDHPPKIAQRTMETVR